MPTHASCQVSDEAARCERRITHRRDGLPGTFEIYGDQRNEYRFRLKAGKGKIVASGESYKTKADAKKGIKAVQTAATNAKIDDLTA